MTEAMLGPLRRVRAGVLDVAFHESGPEGGPPAVLLHGFPYDVHAYAEVVPILADEDALTEHPPLSYSTSSTLPRWS